MSIKDLIVFFLYIIGNISISVYLGNKIKNSHDFFAAGRQSSWWLSGLSAFMTMFSAGTFVVYGGIAFKAGIVAVSISMCLGVSALFVGYFIAGRWRKLGVTSAAEYISLRYGALSLNIYTWFNILYRLLGMAVALYSLAIVLHVIVPEQWDGFFRYWLGTSTVNVIIIFCGIVIVLYAIFGGLWAVLLTDVLQFVILMIAVIAVIPLALSKIGGLGSFLNQIDSSHLTPVNQEFTWVFLSAWIVIHMFKIGGEWAFVQRFVCVPTPADAKKATYLFAVLYLVSPIIWMLPPIIYSVVDPTANFEQAYILACKYALPEGILGLMVASMFAATVSMIDSELNVYAGVLTKDFYKKMFECASENAQVFTGRLFTFLLGVLVTWLAIKIPAMGGAEDIILSITALVAGVTVLPVLWGMVSKKLNQTGVLASILISSTLIICVKYGFIAVDAWFLNWFETSIQTWIITYSRTIEAVAGVIIPLFVLTITEFIITSKSPHFIQINNDEIDKSPIQASMFPAKIMATAIGVLGLIIMVLAITADQDIMVQWILSFTLLVISAIIFYLIKLKDKNMNHTALKKEDEVPVKIEF
ncbi:sodium:solute symporter family transporter [Chondrinema litorale]|uniref:sodium:solute symporter family transporter n=1 Tax=Chondrinema litorale TaxID=2994555 RepID=UPI002543522E|nr:hypothetical protein [Chondrinema litorale]UZR96648.1 hypothetical protein OQ292_21095 [Chondrinema litorale]